MRRLLVFLVIFGFCGAACPDGCTCHYDKGLYVASCSDIPYNAGRIEVLNVLPSQRWDNPQELTDGQFNQARHLKYLNLRNNSLYFIHKKAFYGARGLLEIDLSFNYIEELDPMLFQHLTSLSTLKLRGNPIQLEPEVPFVTSNSIQHLDIGECKLKSVPREVFYGLKRLSYLSLDGNHLKTLKYNSLPKGLKYVDLSKNLIVNVPSEVLSSLTNLRKINLGRNPINCSCSLMNLQDWLSGKGVIFEENVICALPPEYSGISWSKVDENRLCLAEARRDEISRSAFYSKFSKNKLNNQKHFEHENSYSEESLQADQPQLLHSDPQTEVMFQNDEAVSINGTMRDEELKKEVVAVTETHETDEGTENGLNITKTAEEFNKFNNEESQNEEVVLGSNGNEGHATTNLETGKNLEGQNDDIKEKTNENKAKNGTNLELEVFEPTNNKKEAVTNSHSFINTTVSQTEFEDERSKENEINDLKTTQSVDVNGNNSVEFKHFNGNEENDEADDLKNEGFIQSNVKETADNNVTTDEEETITPNIEKDLTFEMSSTDEPPVSEENNVTEETIQENSEVEEGVANNSSSTLEATNSAMEEKSNDEDLKITLPPEEVSEVFTANETQNVSETIAILGEGVGELSNKPKGNPENKSLQEVNSSNSPSEQRIKEVHGAEVLMFCLGVLVICLILYSVYKCRLSSSKRHNIRTAKDMESNRGTEMQDMASLIPKPPEDDGKNHLKYPDKGSSSENVKLITEQNENESPNKKAVDDGKTKTKKEDKNSLNNNTSSSPTSKTPLLKPENPVTINPAEPIQRTRVKVGIIPDSIPRTPIFVQKTYNNGTKHV